MLLAFRCNTSGLAYSLYHTCSQNVQSTSSVYLLTPLSLITCYASVNVLQLRVLPENLSTSARDGKAADVLSGKLGPLVLYSPYIDLVHSSLYDHTCSADAYTRLLQQFCPES